MGKHYVMKICPECMYGVDENEVHYCEECGSQLITKCPHCNEKIRIEKARYCFKCGHSLRPGVNGPATAEQR